MGTVVDRILQISGEEISPDYLTHHDLVKYADEDNRYLYIYDITRSDPVTEVTDASVLAESPAEVNAFALTGTYSIDEYADAVSVSIQDILSRTPLTSEDFPLSHFKVLAVDAEHKGKGIGSAMAARALTPLFAEPPVTAMLWERDNPANIKLAERYANNQLARFEDYFPEDWRCPECGFEKACDCSVTMYGWFADNRRTVTQAG